MAGRLFSKGAAWKKVAVAVCGESTVSVVNESPKSKQYSSCFNSFTMQNQRLCYNSHPEKVQHRTFHTSLNALIESKFRHFSSATGPNNEGSKKTEDVSIISAMFKDQEKHNNNDTQEEKPEADSKDDGGDGQDNKEKAKENPFQRSQRYAKWMLIATFSFGTPALIYEFGPPSRDEQGNIIPDRYSNDYLPIAYVKRTFRELAMVKDDIVEPSSPKLLPDALEYPYYQPPYTLVIELFGVLLQPVYDTVHGWRFKKRPGIDHLLENLSHPLYEIVIFTREQGMIAFPLIDQMDQKQHIMYRLFRDAARYKSGFTVGNATNGEWPKLDPYYQKDLKYLNRDLKRVVVVDTDKRATELQPNNGITLKPWDGSAADTELFDLTAFLHTLANNEVDDVRPVLEHYRSFDDPMVAFRMARAQMEEEQQKLLNDLKENKGRSPAVGSSITGMGVFSRFFRSRN